MFQPVASLAQYPLHVVLYALILQEGRVRAAAVSKVLFMAAARYSMLFEDPKWIICNKHKVRLQTRLRALL